MPFILPCRRMSPPIRRAIPGLALLGQAGMVAVRVADLASPAGRGLGKDGRTALVAASTGKIATGDLVVFCKPAAVARAAVRRDGRVQAAGHPADHARLGLAEERLDALTGRPDVIGQIAAGITLTGKVKGKARRAMTPALAIRLILLMTLVPGADYPEVMAALIGDLAAVPWQRRYVLPTATVACTWRAAVGPGPLHDLRDLLLAAVDAEHQACDYRAVQAGDLDAQSIDGSLTRVPGTRACQFFCVSWGSRCPFVILLWIFSGVRVRRGRGRGTRRRMNSWLLSSLEFRCPAFLLREPARRHRCGAR